MDDRKLRRSYDNLLAQRSSVDRTDCPSADDLRTLILRETDEPTRLRVLDHVMSCPECREDFDRLRTRTTG